MFKNPGNPKIEELTKSIKARSYNLSCLRPIKLEELNKNGKPKRLCAWCASEELFHGNQKYCGRECSESAEAYMYPQKDLGLKFLLIHQNYKCAHCSYDYKPFLEEMIIRDKKRYGGVWEAEELPWHYFKNLKSVVPKEFKPEVDHIKPISKGGVSLGFENHQILCYLDHKIKTKIDNSGPRNK